MKKLAILSLLFLLFACGEPAQEESGDPAQEEISTDLETQDVPVDLSADPEGILLAATDAVLDVNAVSYNIDLEGYFVDGDTTALSLTGTVVLQKGATTDEASVFAEYSLVMGEEISSGTVAADGINAFYVDPQLMEFHHGLIEMGASRLVQSAPQGVLMVEYLITAGPYGAELNAAGYEMLEQEVIDGHLCHVVAVEMPPYTTSTWWIDAETFLPRANRISVWGPDGSGMEYKVTLADINIDIQPDPSTFLLECPDEYSSHEYVGAIAVGSQAPLWTLPTPDGGTIALEDLRGKVVILDFWATWCGPCREVMPTLQEIHEAHGDELVVIGVNTWEQEDPAAFMADNGFTYPIVINGDEVAQEYFVEGIPTFYVIAQDGSVAFHAVGADPANEEALAAVLETLLAE